VILEELLAAKLPALRRLRDFASRLVPLTRDMDIDVMEHESDDMLRAIESKLRVRQHSGPCV
jgi:polyphosphate kinase